MDHHVVIPCQIKGKHFYAEIDSVILFFSQFSFLSYEILKLAIISAFI